MPEPFKSIFDVLKDPAWVTFILLFGIGALALGALFFLYPMSRDTDEDNNL
jgi:hypothetical protein